MLMGKTEKWTSVDNVLVGVSAQEYTMEGKEFNMVYGEDDLDFLYGD